MVEEREGDAMNVLFEKDEGWIQPSSFRRHSIFLEMEFDGRRKEVLLCSL